MERKRQKELRVKGDRKFGGQAVLSGKTESTAWQRCGCWQKPEKRTESLAKNKGDFSKAKRGKKREGGGDQEKDEEKPTETSRLIRGSWGAKLGEKKRSSFRGRTSTRRRKKKGGWKRSGTYLSAGRRPGLCRNA